MNSINIQNISFIDSKLVAHSTHSFELRDRVDPAPGERSGQVPGGASGAKKNKGKKYYFRFCIF